jgi:arylsulfatase A-like enzyme
VLIATGPGVAQRADIRAHIVDCAPTILAMLGLRIPDDMEGRVVTEMFGRPPTVETEQATKPDGTAQVEEVFTPDDLQKVKDRLSDLGYLE